MTRMTRTSLFTFVLAGAIALTAGVAVAAAQDTGDGVDPIPGAVVERDQDRDRVRDPVDRATTAVDERTTTTAATAPTAPTADRDRDCVRDPEVCATAVTTHTPERSRDHVAVDPAAEGTGTPAQPGTGHGHGVLDRTGPVHDSAAHRTEHHHGH